MRKARLSYAFLGTGLFAARCLALLSEWIAPSWVVTPPLRVAKRGRKLLPTPVEELCTSSRALAEVPLFNSENASRDNVILKYARHNPVDFTFVVDFGQVIEEPLLAADKAVGCLNIHPSLLPKYRGAAPLQRALIDGLDSTGVTVFKLAERMDAGPLMTSSKIDIAPDDNHGTLLEKSALAGVRAFIEYSLKTPFDEWSFWPQDEAAATEAPKIASADERICWREDSVRTANRVRALSPKPGAWTTFRGKRLRVLKARSIADDRRQNVGELLGLHGSLPLVAVGGDAVGRLLLEEVQPEGKKAQSAADWWNGARVDAGECLE